MHIALVVDGHATEVDVDLAAGTVTVAGVAHPLKVVRSGGKVELEIDGETVAVEGWPDGLPRPPGPVSVNGEVVALEVRSVAGAGTPRTSTEPAVPVGAVAATGTAPAPAEAGPGSAVVPPMPGKVIDVRVRDGDRVSRGQVLLVLEAMKMRNEVVAPVDGVVAEVRVAPGANVRAREPMLRIVPG